MNEKILILDGYDEISVKDDRKEILDQLYWGVVKNNSTQCFLLIITCRVNYIKTVERVQCKYITLQPWDKDQIESFCKIFCRITNISLDTEAIENIIKNKEILGIPLILYMVLALNISIGKEGSIVDVYDKVFSLEGGIYDRCIDNKSFADRHRVGKMKNQIHQISRDIAIWMFENNPDEAYIPAEEYKKICVNILQQNEDIKQDFIIGIFFKLKHCEGREGEELYFVHRSIYEYFVAEYIFSLIYKAIDSQEDVMCVFGKFLKNNFLSRNMLKYLKIKILNSKLRDNFGIVNESFQIMLQDGMTYHASKYYKELYKNVMDYEMNVFKNMLEILHLWETKVIKFDGKIVKYVKYNIYYGLNLKGANLKGANLEGANLNRANLNRANLIGANLREAELKETNLKGANLNRAKLEGAKLEGTNLERANLKGANLREANLREADLREADLKGANLGGANLIGANLREADLKGADLKGADLGGANLSGANLREAVIDEASVYMLKSKCNMYIIKVFDHVTNETISYGEYRKRRYC